MTVKRTLKISNNKFPSLKNIYEWGKIVTEKELKIDFNNIKFFIRASKKK